MADHALPIGPNRITTDSWIEVRSPYDAMALARLLSGEDGSSGDVERIPVGPGGTVGDEPRLSWPSLR